MLRDLELRFLIVFLSVFSCCMIIQGQSSVWEKIKIKRQVYFHCLNLFTCMHLCFFRLPLFIFASLMFILALLLLLPLFIFTTFSFFCKNCMHLVFLAVTFVLCFAKCIVSLFICIWAIDKLNLDTRFGLINDVCFMQGSFGEILKAHWRGTPVAVKRILPSLSEDRMVMWDSFFHL